MTLINREGFDPAGDLSWRDLPVTFANGYYVAHSDLLCGGKPIPVEPGYAPYVVRKMGLTAERAARELELDKPCLEAVFRRNVQS